MVNEVTVPASLANNWKFDVLVNLHQSDHHQQNFLGDIGGSSRRTSGPDRLTPHKLPRPLYYYFTT
ncbi:hypothetical protein RSAG8_05011, partial [Rhizoctonia solani AG-8 WAC10335]